MIDTTTDQDMSALAAVETPPAPTMEQLQAPTISFKDRKVLMFLYDGVLKKPEKLRGLIRKGYAEVNDKNEIVPTVLGMLLIDFTVRQRNNAKDARKQKLNQQPRRKNKVNVFGQRKRRDIGDVPNGSVSSGDSGEVTDAAPTHISPTI